MIKYPIKSSDMIQFPIESNSIEDLEENLIMKLLEHRNNPSMNFDQNIKMVRCLLERSPDNMFANPGVSRDRREGNGVQFIRKAVRNNSIELCKILFDLGANFNYGHDMLEFAQTPEMIELLLNNGVKMTQKNIRRNYWLGKYIEDANKRQKAYQQLSSAQLPTEYEASRLIGEHLSRMPYNSDVTRRINEEPTLQSKKLLNLAKGMEYPGSVISTNMRREPELMDKISQHLSKKGGKKKRKKTKKKRKKTKKKKNNR